MTGSPGVSVVIPALNAERFLERCVLSVLNNGYQPVEVIVVDNGSRDETARLAESLGVMCVSESTRGAGAARNRGLGLGRFDLLVFLDSDDELLPGAIEALVAGVENSQADFVFGQVINITEESEERDGKEIAHTNRALGAPLASSTLATRAGLARFGPMLNDNHSWTRMIMSARRLGAHIHAIDTVVAHRHIHKDNISHDPLERAALIQVLRELPTRTGGAHGDV